LLLRAGLLSEQMVRIKSHRGDELRLDRPWFMQWLLGWEVTRWLRTTFTHTVMAVPRDGALWLDLPQINFPVIGTTWRESDSGPATDRLFSVQMEGRWRQAPWPLLPSTAGRAYWEYGGTDFLPSGPGGIIPQISLPASIAGIELVSPRWDLAGEYAETLSEKVLWYSNSGFAQGYTHDGWLLALPLGGGAEALTALLRLRPRRWPLEVELKANRTDWKQSFGTAGSARKNSLAVAVTRRPGLDQGTARLGMRTLAAQTPLLWRITAEFNEETARPIGQSAVSRNWWRVYLTLGI